MSPNAFLLTKPTITTGCANMYNLGLLYLIMHKDDGMKKFVEWIKTPNKEDQRPYGGRYVGSLVSDFHRNLLYGGIFMYPKGEAL